MKLSPTMSCLVAIDVQERLAPAIAGRESVVEMIGRLLRAAGRLDIPIVATEQNPAGLGHTINALDNLVPSEARVEKLTFDASQTPGLRDRLEAAGARQIVICGMEAHVCVLQTALGLKADGYEVFAVADAVGSRSEVNREAGMRRLEQAGIVPVTSEMVIFEWLGRSDHEAFRELLELIK